MGGKIVGAIVVAAVLYGACPLGKVMGQSVAVGAPSESAVGSIRVTLDVRDESVERVLRMIVQQAGLKLFFPAKMIPSSARVTMQVHGTSVVDAIERALVGTGLQARVTADMVVLSAVSTVAAPMAQGSIIGKVIDAKTHQGVRGATVTLHGTTIGTTTREDGGFRLSDVGPGTYAMQVRMLGYTKASRTVTIADGQTASVDVVLEPSINALDQVIVTGTIVATTRKAVPNAMTVITAADIETRGITQIQQLFRGDIPGLFAVNLGSSSSLDSVVMFARGATTLPSMNGNAPTTTIKTYVDGVELANASYLSQIDPQSIERIEIIAGPQASTIYGSNAINGVMQIFTKRGSPSGRPQVTATLLSGIIQNNFRTSLAPQHDDAMQVSGVEGAWSYSLGGAWNYVGPWSPGKTTTRTSGSGGVRIQRGPVTGDATFRLTTTRNLMRGDIAQRRFALQETGEFAYQPSFSGRVAPTTATLTGQTMGLTLRYTPLPRWSHELVIGNDGLTGETLITAYANRTAADTLLNVSQSQSTRSSVRYATTIQAAIAPHITATIILGADEWQTMTSSLRMNTSGLTGTLSGGTPTVRRQPGHNTGGFVQGQAGLWDAMFLTYGLRAEWNPDYGDNAQPNWAPRYGLSYTRDIETLLGPVTAKLRISYGRSTRPPAVGQKVAVASTNVNQGVIFPFFDEQLANPDLGPEFQQGGDGGIELYVGQRGSLQITRYNQTVDGLIIAPNVDSVPSVPGRFTPPIYVYQWQNLNLASIRNQGWEVTATSAWGPLSTRGTYSWTKSRNFAIDPRYRASFPATMYPQYQPGASALYLPEHTWAWQTTYARQASTITLAINGTGMLYRFNDELSLQTTRRLTTLRPINTLPAGYRALGSGYTTADFNVSHRFTPWLEGQLQVQNLTNFYQNDANTIYAVMGRQSKAGVRFRW